MHGEAANAGHRVLAPDDAEVEAYLEQALHAPPPQRVETEAPEHPDTVVILDFGSQFAQLIARRVRELNVYSELLPHDTPMAELERRGAKAVILSGGPSSVYDTDAPRADPALWSGRIPVLGICYGLQLMAHELGGEVAAVEQARVRPGDGHVHRCRWALCRHRARAAGLDEPRRLDRAAAAGLPADRPDRFDAVRRPGRSRPQPVRHPVPPRGRPYAARPRRAAQLHRRTSPACGPTGPPRT